MITSTAAAVQAAAISHMPIVGWCSCGARCWLCAPAVEWRQEAEEQKNAMKNDGTVHAITNPPALSDSSAGAAAEQAA
jgi:hypothetical protein